MQQTSSVKLAVLFRRFRLKELVLRTIKSKIVGENTINGDNLKIGSNDESSKDKKAFFGVFLRISYPRFNLRIGKYVHLDFSIIACFFTIFKQLPAGFGS